MSKQDWLCGQDYALIFYRKKSLTTVTCRRTIITESVLDKQYFIVYILDSSDFVRLLLLNVCIWIVNTT